MSKKKMPSFDLEKLDDKTSTYFSISWLELEVLKILTKSLKPVYKGEMINNLKSKYSEISTKPESSFYAIFDRLEDDRLVSLTEIKGEGYKKFLSITQEGMFEFKRALNWGISTIFEGMVEELISVLNEFCVGLMGCKKENDFGIISPNNPEFLVPESCNACVKPVDANLFHRFNILMPYSKDMVIPYYQNIKAQPDNIPLKSDYLQRILSILSLGLLKEKQANELINEVHRILEPGGKVVFIEIVEFESYLYESLNKLTHGFDLFIPKKGTSSLTQFSPQILKEKIERVF
ncbi:MAG: PadR family transcriptional regulator, partial [Candidatus Heimdallarchaeota archaeon]|nr:PadR family transcriptional regulator [Candidatus Heimdallarchaeota archaeon]